MSKFFRSVFFLALFLILFSSLGQAALAADVHLTIRNGDTIIHSDTVALPTGITSIDDSEGNAHGISDTSVLAVLKSADEASADFELSEITYFSSFGSLYLKCITAESVLCDDWQYVVDGASPSSSIDQKTVSDGDVIYVYFGPTSRIELSSDTATTEETVAVRAYTYDYEHNAWATRAGITVGLTQPNPSDPFSPLEILTAETDGEGQVQFSSIPAGSYNVGIQEDYYFPTEALTVTAPSGGTGSSGSSGGSSSKNQRKSIGSVLGAETKKLFDTKKAFEFLIAAQKEDGSFGEDIYTDWAAIALVSGNYQENILKLVKYYGESKLVNPRLTDYERRAMALMALGLNPYGTAGTNYIAKITESFDGSQFGNPEEDNDDIFALLPLLNAGFGPEEDMIQKSILFVLSRQRENGSWDESIDMTGAAIAVLSRVPTSEAVEDALAKAKAFLHEAQNGRKDGGWGGSASSTAWAIEGIKALGEKPEDWERMDFTPEDFLVTIQDTDGGIKGETLNNRIWETAYVLSALSGKTWSETMQKFAKMDTPNLEEGPVTLKTEKPQVPASKPKPKVEPVQNAAAVISVVENPKPSPAEAENVDSEPQQSWFRKLLRNIFGF